MKSLKTLAIFALLGVSALAQGGRNDNGHGPSNFNGSIGNLSNAMAPIALIILLLLITQLNNHLNGETIPLMETRLHHLKTIPLMVEDISTNKKVVTSTIKLMEEMELMMNQEVLLKTSMVI